MIPEKVKKVLDQHGLAAIEFEEGSTSTSLAAAERLEVSVGQIAKSLLFTGRDGRYYMVLCAGDARVSTSRLKKVVGVKTRMATPEETRKMTGFDPGGVCPFGVTGIDILLDTSLQAYDTVYPAAGTDSSGVPITFGQLAEITGNRVCDVTVPADPFPESVSGGSEGEES